MRFTLPSVALLGCVVALVSGCIEHSPPEPAAEPTPETPSTHNHSHAGGDALVWVEKDIKHVAGFELALGHHGKHLHAATSVEPAVSITRDGAAVADAKVFNALVSADGTKVIREEVATVYEPESADEPAHYAQGTLHLPKGSPQFVIRFHIVLPGVKEDFTRDITIEVAE